MFYFTSVYTMTVIFHLKFISPLIPSHHHVFLGGTSPVSNSSYSYRSKLHQVTVVFTFRVSKLQPTLINHQT